jgi:hypothetical protein
MKDIARIAITAALMPALFVSSSGQTRPPAPKPEPLSSAAQALLRNAELGGAKVTLTDASLDWVYIRRVTDQFVSIDRGGSICDNVELSKIAKIQWGLAPNECCSGPSMLFGLLLSPVLWPYLINYDIASKAPIYGQWESTPAAADGLVHRLRFEYRGAWDGHDPVVWGQDAVVRNGRYRFVEGQLNIHYDDDATDEDLGPVQFACDQLAVREGSERFGAEWTKPDRANAPIIGR